MKLTMLGTGHALVTECYNTCFVISDKDCCFLVDGGGGNGILRQLKSAQINITAIHDVFITHKHTDHLLGIVWVVRQVASQINHGIYKGVLRIYGHDESLRILFEIAKELLTQKEFSLINDQIQLVHVQNGRAYEIIGYKTTFFDIGSSKAKQYGFLMELGNAGKLCCCGDEPLKEQSFIYAKDSTWLLHEAFCLYADRDIYKPYEKHHSTVREACETAEHLGVQNLVLYHTEDCTLSKRKSLYSEEARLFYHGNIFVPYDLEEIDL